MFEIVVEKATSYVIGVGPFQNPDEFGDEYAIYEIEEDGLYDNLLKSTYTKYDVQTKKIVSATRP